MARASRLPSADHSQKSPRRFVESKRCCGGLQGGPDVIARRGRVIGLHLCMQRDVAGSQSVENASSSTRFQPQRFLGTSRPLYADSAGLCVGCQLKHICTKANCTRSPVRLPRFAVPDLRPSGKGKLVAKDGVQEDDHRKAAIRHPFDADFVRFELS